MHDRVSSIPVMERDAESMELASAHDGDASLASPQVAYHDTLSPAVASHATPRANAQPATHSQLDGKAVSSNWLAVASRYRWYQTWYALRWKLARGVFARPLPYLTAHWDLKLGDALVTLPVAGALIAVCAVQLADLQTKNSGGAAQIAMAITFVLTVRNNSLLLVLTGLSFERAILYHKLFGAVTFITSSMHGLSYLLKHHQVYGDENSTRVFTSDELDDANASAAASGLIAYAPLTALMLFSLNAIRRRWFELFYRLHWLLFIAIFVGALSHNISAAIYATALWAIDALYRLVYRTRVYANGSVLESRKSAGANSNAIVAAAADDGQATVPPRKRGVISASQVTVWQTSHDVVQLSFPRLRTDTNERFDYSAGQFAFVCVPSLSLLEWHPFSISSAPHEEFVTFHIKALGDWTRKFQALVQQHEAAANPVGGTTTGAPLMLEILLDGPYGNVSLDVAAYSHVALFSGGIGITPMRSIVNELYANASSLKLQRVHFVWSVRDVELLYGMLAPSSSTDAQSEFGASASTRPAATYFPTALTAASTSQSVFTTEIFVTKTVERDLEHPVAANATSALAKSIRYGTRPDITATLRALGDDARQHKQLRVAVLVCGPAALIRDVVKTSIRLSRELSLHFDVHTETFEL